MKNKKVIKRKRKVKYTTGQRGTGKTYGSKALEWLRVTSTSPDSKAIQTRINKIK